MNRQYLGRKLSVPTTSDQEYPQVVVPDHLNASQNMSPIQPQFGPQIYQPNLYNNEQQFYPQTSTPKQSKAPLILPQGPTVPAAIQPPQFIPDASVLSPFTNATVQNLAYQYGQQLTNTGADYMKQEFEKFIPTTTLKYYFAVDTKYVAKKLLMALFPFLHTDWSIKYEHQNPVQPRYEINAPDLYIPVMAFVTYILLAGIVMGTQKRFSPELLGILSSKVIAWWLIEIATYTVTLYIMNIQTILKTYDLIAYSGYKFIGIILSIISGLCFSRSGYYITLIYCGLALVFFILRSVKAKVLTANQSVQNQFVDHSLGNKRRLYFLLFLAILQPLFSWWFSYEFL